MMAAGKDEGERRDAAVLALKALRRVAAMV
jgi:hypothetical protein